MGSQQGPAGGLPPVRVRRSLPATARRRTLAGTPLGPGPAGTGSGAGEGGGTGGAGEAGAASPAVGGAGAAGPAVGGAGAAPGGVFAAPGGADPSSSARPAGATRVAGSGGGGRRAAVVAAAVVGVLVAAGSVVLGLGGGGDGDGTPRLTVAAGPPPLAVEAAGVGRSVELAGPLPDGPATGTVRDLPAGAAGEEQVVRLAAALGLDGMPRRDGDRWVVAGLTVSDAAGNPWELRTADGEPPVLTLPRDPGTTVSSPVDGPGPRPTRGQLETAAAPVLAALGLAGAEVRYPAGDGRRDAVAAPVVDGLPTAGMETWLRYAPGPRLVGAAGWLGAPAPGGPAYPLVSAEQALAALPAGPEIAMGCVPQARRCGPPAVTGARPGLLLGHAGRGRVVLLPAWLFVVRGSDAPLPAVAVDPRYLRPALVSGGGHQPSAAPTSATPDAGPAGSAGSNGGPGPAAPGSAGSNGDPGTSAIPAPPGPTR
jgi:hypothetical protein